MTTATRKQDATRKQLDYIYDLRTAAGFDCLSDAALAMDEDRVRQAMAENHYGYAATAIEKDRELASDLIDWLKS